MQTPGRVSGHIRVIRVTITETTKILILVFALVFAAPDTQIIHCVCFMRGISGSRSVRHFGPQDVKAEHGILDVPVAECWHERMCNLLLQSA